MNIFNKVSLDLIKNKINIKKISNIIDKFLFSIFKLLNKVRNIIIFNNYIK